MKTLQLILGAGLVVLQLHSASSQEKQDSKAFRITLNEAINFAQLRNKAIQVAKLEAHASTAEKLDVERGALPTISTNASYQRFSNLVRFTDGLGGVIKGERLPTSNGANLGIDALFNIYAGGRQRALQQEALVRERIANVALEDQLAGAGLQTATQYLEMVRLQGQRNFVIEQIRRADVRLKNIEALYRNQKVTRNDLLRAQVMKSNVELTLEQTVNDLWISNQKLNVIMDLPDSVRIIVVDSTSMNQVPLGQLKELVYRAGVQSFGLQRAAENIYLQQARLKLVKSNAKPSLAFYSAYGFNYPNFLFNPPVDQLYAIGFVGLKAQFNISSIYQNRQKVVAAKTRVRAMEVQQSLVRDQFSQEAQSYLIKYQEALTRISVTERSIEQSRVNYNIVNKKYLNQLALLTELLDADNLLQESQFTLLKTRVDAIMTYYRLKYISGNL